MSIYRLLVHKISTLQSKPSLHV